MKKSLFFILILTALTGLLGGTHHVKAEDELGTCEGPVFSYPNVLRSNCPIPPNQSFTPSSTCQPPKVVIDGKCVDEPLGTCTALEKRTNTGVVWKDITKKVCNSRTEINTNYQLVGWVENGTCEPPKQIQGGKCVTPSGTGPTPIDTTYTFLAPLPCDSSRNIPGCVGGELTTFDPTGDNKIGGYLNIMIRIFIGICAVLAVIMIVVGGIEYMTSELISSKENGRHRIRGAIFGLVLALGAWTLLNTINPDLLRTDLKTLENVEVVVNLEEDTETVATAQTQSDSITGVSTTEQCSEGIVQISTSGGSIALCKRISEKVWAMIGAAQQSNIKLSGGGFRSKTRQETLRAQNCGGSANVYNKNAKCNPLTAYPGKSRHENGLAVDFKCDGTLIQSTDNKCFLWLKANASKYGLANLPQEPWHWSTDGR